MKNERFVLVFVRVRFCHCWLVTDCIIEAAVNRTNVCEAHSTALWCMLGHLFIEFVYSWC